MAHPQQVKLIWHARCKTDPIDARKLADLLRTKLTNRIHAYLAEQNERVEVSDLYGQAGRTWLETVPVLRDVREQVEFLLALVDQLTEQVRRLDRRIRDRVTLSAEAKQLMTIPGVGPYGALLILAELGPRERFPSAGHGRCGAEARDLFLLDAARGVVVRAVARAASDHEAGGAPGPFAGDRRAFGSKLVCGHARRGA